MARPERFLTIVALLAALSAPAMAGDNPTLADAESALARQDYDTAFALLSALAIDGVPEAQYRLAAIFRTGQGQRPDEETAFHWMRAAALGGHPEAQFNLGKFYLSGQGTTPDRAKGLRWIERASSAGVPAASDLLSRLNTTSPVPLGQEEGTPPTAGQHLPPIPVPRPVWLSAIDPQPGRERITALVASGRVAHLKRRIDDWALPRAARLAMAMGT